MANQTKKEQNEVYCQVVLAKIVVANLKLNLIIHSSLRYNKELVNLRWQVSVSEHVKLLLNCRKN